jgi:hypothetical protein
MYSCLKILLALVPCVAFATTAGRVDIVAGRVTIKAGRVAIGPQGTPAPADVTNGLYAWWKFDGNANDSFSTNNGTVTGCVETNGKIGTAYYFNGTDNSISASARGYNPGTNLTISLWYYVTNNYEKQYSMLVTKSDATANAQLEIRHQYSNTGKPNYSGKFTAFHELIATNLLPVDAWVFLAFAYDGATLSMYTNGYLHVTKAVTGAMNAQAAQPVLFGRRSDATAYWYKGRIDDARFYSRHLTAAEIQQIWDLYK